MTELSANPAIAIGSKLIADRRDIGDDLSVVSLHRRCVVIGRTRQAHQPASFGNGDAVGPVKTDVLALLGTRFRGPVCRPYVRVPRSLLRTPKKVSRAGILIKSPSLKLLHPDSDQVARDVMAFGETVEGLARNEVQGDLRLNSMLWVRCLAMAFIL